MLIFFKLLFAHIVTDFIIQPDKWVKDKWKYKLKSIYLYLHVLLTGALAYVILADPKQWQIPLFITITHFLIDYWKLRKSDNLIFFLLDQFFHLVVLILSAVYLSKSSQYVFESISGLLNNERNLIIAVAYLIIIWPVGFTIGKATVRWRKEIEDLTPEKDSLNEAGKWIGIFERILVLTFVLVDQYPAIGFLIAAKSILRFGDKNTAIQRKQTEYVLVGTLMSFTIAIFIGILARYLGEL